MVDNARTCKSCRGNGQSPVNSNNNSCSLMKKLQKIDFAITETVLYLDAYPESKTALSYYHKLVNERNKLVDELAKNGTPITNINNYSSDDWMWTKGPWPWEAEAN